MNARILLIGLAAASLTSCATAYKTGQTPDDVYFSPAKPEEAYVQYDKNEDDNDYYSLDDYRLRMEVRNRDRYSYWTDDWYYDNWNTSNSWRYGWNNPWTWNTGYTNINSGWYYSYNPWCYAPYPSYTNYSTNKTFNYKPPIRNFGSSNTVATTYNPKTGYSLNTGSYKPVKVYNNSNKSGSGFGNFLRQILIPSGSSSNSSSGYSGSGNNTRTYNPSSSSGSGSSRSSGSSSGGGSTARPARNGKG